MRMMMTARRGRCRPAATAASRKSVPEKNQEKAKIQAVTDDRIGSKVQTIADVVWIKKVLDKASDAPLKVVLMLLRMLQWMALSPEILKETEIEKPVYDLQDHGVKYIRDVAKNLIDDWRSIRTERKNSSPPCSMASSATSSTAAVEEVGGLSTDPQAHAQPKRKGKELTMLKAVVKPEDSQTPRQFQKPALNKVKTITDKHKSMMMVSPEEENRVQPKLPELRLEATRRKLHDS